jgi:hypothetical protein
MFRLMQNLKLRASVILLMMISFANMSFRVNPGAELLLTAGTPVAIETIGMIISDGAAVGQIIDLKVRADVKVGEKVVIAKGTLAKGQVIRVQAPKGLGKEGFIEIQIKSVQAVDGQEVQLASGSIYKEGQDKATLSIVLGIFVCILFLFMKGKNAEIPPGYQIDATVASNVMINA